MRRRGDVAEVRAMDRYFADDVILVTAHPKPETLACAARRLKVFLERRLGRVEIQLGDPSDVT